MAESAVSFLLQRLLPVLENKLNLFTEVQTEVVDLKTHLEVIRAFLRVADALEKSDEELRVWVKQVRDVAHETEDILDELELVEAHNRTSMFYGSIRNMKARYRIANELKGINSRIKTIFKTHKRFRRKLDSASEASSSNSSGNTWHDQRGDALLLDNTDLVGIDRPKKKLMRCLMKACPIRKVISVTGMGGMGKTTLVKQVYDDPEVIKHFTACAWVTVSQSCVIEELLRDLAHQLFSEIRRPVPLGLENMRHDKLKRIIKDLLQRRRYLVVFDDVWHVHQWEAVKYALPDNSCGRRIMITTRRTDLVFTSGPESKGKVYNLKPLKEDEAWELFCRKTFHGDPHSCPSYLTDICKYILRKCDGLPLAIVAISGVMAMKDQRRIDEWAMICRTLGDEIQGNSKLDNLKTVLGYSFNDLPHYLKYCFLYLSIFPEDHEIQRMRLIRLWIAEGFIEAKEGKTMEDVAEDYLKELLNRNLVQVAGTTSDGRVKTLRIHDLLREIIISKSKDQNFAAIVKEQTAAWPEKIRRLSVQGTSPNGHQQRSASQLRSLLMFGMVEKISLGKLFPRGFKLLRVLDFQDAPLNKFPVAVVDLYHLRYLSLRNTKVQMVPGRVLGKLQNLETLDLKMTWVRELPADILKLKKLRHLLVYQFKVTGYAQFYSKNGFTFNFKAPFEIGNLQSLQKLCFVEANHGYSGMMIKQLGELTQLRRLGIMKLKEEDGKAFCVSIERLTNLRAISVSSEGEDKVIDLQFLSSPPPFLERLYLLGRLQELPSWIPSLHGLARIFLKWSSLKHDPLVYLQDLPNLAHLELLQVYDGDTLHFRSEKFKKLKVLGLDMFHGVSEVIVGEGAMPCLETLSIGRCGLLKKVPTGIERLTMVKVLEFFDMPDELMHTICPHGLGSDYWKVSHIPEVYSTYWQDGGWDVYSVGSSRDCSPRSGTAMRCHERRNPWKV